ncbi:MAG: hypothetical protein FWB97_06785 [Oscillospiraceae bacterium]|nr:hypothetical protein [Oscillospiraceae bacterium]
MKAICKVLFDLSCYYALSGFLLLGASARNPSIWGLPLLVVTATASILTRRRLRALSGNDAVHDSESDLPRALKIALCLFPALHLPFDFSLWQFFQFLPAWLYVVYVVLTNRVNTNRDDFEGLFKITVLISVPILILLFVIFSIADINVLSVPYFIVYLLSGVCLMRILREEGELSSRRSISVMLVLLLSGAALAYFQAPAHIFRIAGFLFQHVISPILSGIAYVLGMIVYAILWVIIALLSLFGAPAVIEHQYVPGDAPDAVPILGGHFTPHEAGAHPAWLWIAAQVILAALVAFVIFLILRRILGTKAKHEHTTHYTEEREKLLRPSRSKDGMNLRPKDPRLAIRWYYRKYLKEGESRGALQNCADTSFHILKKHDGRFPAEESKQLRDIYIAARYCLGEDVAKAQADAASKLWRKLK